MCRGGWGCVCLFKSFDPEGIVGNSVCSYYNQLSLVAPPKKQGLCPGEKPLKVTASFSCIKQVDPAI